MVVMKLAMVPALLLSTLVAVRAQPPFGEFRAKVSPKEAKVGQTVYFSAEINSVSGDGGWNSGYRIVRKSAPPADTFLVLVHSGNAHGPIPLGSGYYGPRVGILPESLGVHLIRFDSTSEYQHDLADTVTFKVVAATGLRPVQRIPAEAFSRSRFRLNGKRIR